jgi:dihydrofolate reductase
VGNIVAINHLTLDGIMQGPPEDPAVAHQAWMIPYWDEDYGAAALEALRKVDAFLLGRVTYEWFAAYWPNQTEGGEYAERMNSLPKHVVSRSLSGPLEWNAHLIEGDLATEVNTLKQRYDGDIYVYGSQAFSHSLRKLDLIDQYRLSIYPVVLGRGRRYFSDPQDATNLKLVDTKTSSKGIVTLTYTRDRTTQGDAGQ